MKVDSHNHFWLYNDSDFKWIDSSMTKLQCDFLPRDVRPELESLGYQGSIAVQAAQTVHETEFLLELSERFPEVLGVVGWVDLSSPYVDRELERFHAHPAFKGVRHIVQDEPEGFLLRPDFHDGVRRLSHYGLTYDLLIRARQMPEGLEFVARFPDLPIVLDHMAKPPIRDGIIDDWRKQIRLFASHSNVFCKLSGLVTEADWHHWSPSALRPYVQEALESFGPARVMIGSDYPVCLLGGAFEKVMLAYEELVSDLSETEQSQILGATAAGFYGVA